MSSEPNLLPILFPRGSLLPTTSVYSWGGSGFLGALSRGMDDIASLPISSIPSLSPRTIVDISCGSYSTAAISEQGELFLSGLNDEGQLILSNSEEKESNTEMDVIFKPREVSQLIGQRIVQVALGEKHVACVNSSWQALAFGASETGALGTTLTPSSQSLSPRVIKGLSANKIVQVACGVAHSLILTRFGMVFSTGSGLRGALGHGDQNDKTEATRIKALTSVPVAQIACGDDFSLAVSVTGELFTWGGNKYGQLGRRKDIDVLNSPDPLSHLPEAIRFASAGAAHSAIISHSGRLYTAGKNDKQQLGIGSCNEPCVEIFSQVTSFLKTVIVTVNSFKNEDGVAEMSEIFSVSYPPTPPSSSSSSSSSSLFSSSTDKNIFENCQVREVACGSRHTLILLVNGNVFSAGDRSEGATGFEPTSPQKHVLEQVDALSQKGVFRIAAGGNHNAAIRITNGSAVACLPGIRPFGVMAFQNAKSFEKAIAEDKAMPEPRRFTKTRALVREVFSNASVLAGSFSTGPGAVAKYVETNCPENQKERTLKKEQRHSPDTIDTSIEATATTASIQDMHTAAAATTTALSSVVPTDTTSDTMMSRSSTSLSFIRVPAVDMEIDYNEETEQTLSSSSPVFPMEGYSTPPPIAPITPRRVPRTPLGLSSTVELARASETTDSLVTLTTESSGLDITGLLQTYASLITSGSLEVVNDLCEALAVLIGEIETVCMSRAENDLCSVRALYAAFLASVNSQANLPIMSLTFARLCSILLAIPQPKRDLLVSWAVNELSCEDLGLRVVRALQAHISHHWKNILSANMPRQHYFGLVAQNRSQQIQGASSLPTPPFPRTCISHGYAFEWCVRVLRCIYLANRGKSERVEALPYSAFFNADLSTIPDALLVEDFHLWTDRDRSRRTTASPLALCGYPFVFDASAKRRIVLIEAHMMMQHEAHSAMSSALAGQFGQFNFGGGMMPVPMQPFLSLTVRRTHLLSDTLRQLMGARPNELRKQIKVQFVGEEGIDQGGVTKELFSLLVSEVFDIKYGLWVYNADSRTAWPHPIAGVESSSEFKLLGMIMGLACHNGILLDAHFPLALYKKLLGIETKGLADLKSVNPGLANGLQKLLDHLPAEEVADVFCLNFEASYEAFGEAVTQELCPNGKELAVTGENRQRYVQLYVDWVLNVSTELAMTEFKKGFELLLSGPTLQMLQPEELELLVTGTPHLDFKQLERVTAYDGGFTADDPTIKNLWTVIHSFTDELKRKLLLFVTGSAKAPIGGLSNLTFKVQKNGASDSNSLPQASTCFNILLLPPYLTLTKLRERLTTAIQETEGFGMK